MNLPLKLLQSHCKNALVRFASNGRINHYDSLGVSSQATQADIKSAYYKLSMVYHPDKNKDSEGAAQKFRSISEAYEVLGNVRSRKLYDRGLIGFNYRSSATYSEPEHKFYKAREVKYKPPTPSGTGRVYYDFDEWSKAHYGKTFEDDMKRRERARYSKWKKDTIQTDERIERTAITIGLMLMLTSFMMYNSRNLPYDSPAKK